MGCRKQTNKIGVIERSMGAMNENRVLAILVPVEEYDYVLLTIRDVNYS